MKRLAALAVLAALAPSSLAQDAPATYPGGLVDVPPCHWAAPAVRRAVEAGIIQGFPASSAELAGNALRQVFEGLKCNDSAWTSRFLEGAPAGLAAPALSGFDLRLLETRVTGETARVRFRVTVVPEGDQAQTREGIAELARDATAGWRVRYASLAALGLPGFPR